MKSCLFLMLLVTVALVWFRSGMRWGRNARSNLVALVVFVIMLLGMVGLLLFATKLF